MSAITRRALIGGTVASAGTLALHAANARATTLLPYPFTLGVASGEPLPDGIVLWTRLAPRPLEGGGMPRFPLPVLWEIAEDERCRRVVRRGIDLALPEFGHSIHADVRGLRPGREYFYRFIVGRHESPIGRTVTAPSPYGTTRKLRFAFASCQDWQNGYYTAYADMARQDLDLVVHLGDYIYEYAADPAGPRAHIGSEVESLVSYRNRYAQYRTDRNLQAAHARFPFVVTPDDHEVENNHADLVREEGANPNTVSFARRRANAYRAYWEHMPLRASSLPRGADIQLYRDLQWGNLANFQVLDTRQYRSDQPCGDGLKPRCAAALDPNQTMTGPKQERWLLKGLDRSRAKWNVIAQQVQFAQIDFNPPPGPGANELFIMDQWDGYVAARNRILSFLQARKPSNPVIITGDIHSSWVHDIKADFANPASATLATEFVGTSITSDFPVALIPAVQAALAANPHIKFFDGRSRGYVRCELTRNEWRTDFRAVSSIATPTAAASTLRSFVVRDGVPGALPA